MRDNGDVDMLKNIVMLCSFVLMVSFNAYAQNSNENEIQIKYGYPNQSIFIATKNGIEQPVTPMLFVADELFKRVNLTWRATAYPAKRLFRNLKSGKTNFSILVRASSLLDSCIFSEKPIYSTNLNVYYIGDKPPITSKEDLKGKRLVTIRGYSYGSLRKFIEDPENNITKEVTNTHSSAFRMLQLGRADYLLDYASAAQDIISQSFITDLRSNKMSQLDIFLVLSKAYPNAEGLMQQLEDIVQTIDINEIVRRSGAQTTP